MARLRLLVVCTAAVGLIAATSLSAAEKGAAKSPAAKPRIKVAVETVPDPFADAKTSKSPVRPSQRARATHRPEPSILGTPSHPGEAEARIEAALASRTVMDFNEAPLQDVIDYLKDAHKIEIQIARRVLEDVNVTGETPVTINVKGISLKSALRLMFRNMQPELTYIIKNEVLLITTPDTEDEDHVTRVYDVADLVVCRDEHDALWEDYDALIDVITSVTKPTSWDEAPPGSIRGQTLGTAKVLVVTHKREIQQQIADLLAKIRDVAKKNPNAAIPRRNRPITPPQHAVNRIASPSAGNTSGYTLIRNVPDPAMKPAATIPPEQKPVELKPTEQPPGQTPPQPKQPGNMR
jgi:hypothetical protein